MAVLLSQATNIEYFISLAHIRDSDVIMVIDPDTGMPAPIHLLHKKYSSLEKCALHIKVDHRMPPKCQEVFEIPHGVITFTVMKSLGRYGLKSSSQGNDMYPTH